MVVSPGCAVGAGGPGGGSRVRVVAHQGVPAVPRVRGLGGGTGGRGRAWTRFLGRKGLDDDLDVGERLEKLADSDVAARIKKLKEEEDKARSS